MGRVQHEEWEGYIPLRENRKIIGAKCVSCTKVMRKMSKAGLATHKYLLV